MNLVIRWLIRRDMPEVLDIEMSAFDYCWSEEDFLCCLRQRECIGMVAYDTKGDQKILGFMIYELHKAKLHILNFAVHPDYRRQGVGTAMVDRLKDKLSQQRRKQIALEVRETNLPAQKFFSTMGFRCIGVARQFYGATDEDAYRFLFDIEAAKREQEAQSSLISQFIE